MRHRFHLSALVVIALLSTQTAEECTSAFLSGLLTPTDLAEKGKETSDPALQAGASVADAIEYQAPKEEEVRRAVERHEPQVVEQAIRDFPNDVHLRLLRGAMAIAEDNASVSQVALFTAVGVATANSGKTHNDLAQQRDLRVGMANALLQVMDTYGRNSDQWGRLQLAYCANLKALAANPGAADFLALDALPDMGCPR